MKGLTTTFAVIALALLSVAPAHAGQDDMDVTRLNGSLDQLAHDPTMSDYALAEQARARAAIHQLQQASGADERAHALYLAERRVDLAKTAAQLQVAQVKLNQLDREHAQILLEQSRREADMARRELERQRLQYQLAQEESARLQQQGQAYSQAAEQARAEAARAKKLAAAQSRVAKAARREAALAAQAAKAMRSQLQDDQPTEAAPATQKKPASQSKKRH